MRQLLPITVVASDTLEAASRAGLKGLTPIQPLLGRDVCIAYDEESAIGVRVRCPDEEHFALSKVLSLYAFSERVIEPLITRCQVIPPDVDGVDPYL